MEQLKQDSYYTYADYLTWGEDTRYELINGSPYAMSPAPGRIHQEVSGALYSQLYSFLRGKVCKVYSAPFDVRLNADEEDDTVVQPDITVICDKSKLDDKGCKGVPDMIIEILSPSSARRDKLEKFQLYRRVGIREYWIVDPETKTVAAHVLKDGQYIVTAFGDTDNAPVHVLGDCVLSLAEVFEE